MSLCTHLAEIQARADSAIASARKRLVDADRVAVQRFAERFIDPLTEAERRIVAAMRSARTKADEIDLYLQLHPSKPEERLGDNEARMEVRAWRLGFVEFAALMHEIEPTPVSPAEATIAEPGTPAKIDVMADRYMHGEHIHHAKDLQIDPLDMIAREVSRGKNGRAKAGQLRWTKGDV